MLQFLKSVFEPEVHDIGYVFTAPALLYFAVRSGQKRKRMNTIYLFVAMLIPVTVINASFLYLQRYLEWKKR